MATDITSQRVSIIGLGLMGSALAEALMNAGHEVTVWNRTANKSDVVARNGARVAASAAEAISAAEVTIVCVTNHAATMEILGTVGDTDAVDTKVLIQLSTMSADDSRETARWADTRGIHYVEGTILGLPTDITSGSATLIYSGPQEVFDGSKVLLQALGDPK